MADPDQVSEAVEELPVVAIKSLVSPVAFCKDLIIPPVNATVITTHHDGKGAPETLSSASAGATAQQLLSSSSSLGRHGGPPTHGRRPRRPNPPKRWRNALHKMHYVKTKLRGRRGNDHADNGQGWDYTSSEKDSDEDEEAPTQLFSTSEVNDIVINAERIERTTTLKPNGTWGLANGTNKDGHIDNELVNDNMAGVLRGFLTERRADQILGMLKSTNAYITLIVVAWLLVGTLFYKFIVLFTWVEALYFAVQAGLSIGFGAPGVTCTNANWQEECRIMKEDLNLTYHRGEAEFVSGTPCHLGPVELWGPVDCANPVDPDRYIKNLPGPLGSQERCRLFTTVYVLLGSSFVAVGVGLFVQNMLQSASSWSDEERQRAKAKKARLMATNTAAGKQSKTMMNAATVANGAVNALQHEVLNARGKPVNMQSWKGMLQGVLPNKKNLVTYLAILWFVMGVIFAHFEMEFSVVKSIYFSFTALSTGGLEAPLADNDWAMVFTAIYCLTGVPMYVIFLGSLAGFIAERRHREQLRSAIYTQIDGSDNLLTELRSFRQAQATRQVTVPTRRSHKVSQAKRSSDTLGVRSSRRGTGVAAMAPPSSVDLGINYAEYLELILMRRGVVSFDELEQISARFDALDLDHDGTLSQTDIDISNLFDLYDFNHDGLIDLASFAQLCVDIIVVTENHRFARQISTKEDVEKLFDVIDALDPAHKKMISASHFFMWWSGEIGRGHNHQSGQSFHMTHPRSSNLETLAVAELAHRQISADDHPKPGATQCTEV